jgi:hypothetical protein
MQMQKHRPQAHLIDNHFSINQLVILLPHKSEREKKQHETIWCFI